MPLPKELIALATLGTASGAASVPQMDGALGQLLSHLQKAGPEAQLLATVSGIKLREQAGYRPGVMDNPVPEPCEPEDLPPCSPQAMRHLMVMLEGHFEQCIPEWLTELAQSDRRVPEEALPLLLETGRKRDEFCDLIVPVLGKRGEWLAQEVTNRNWNWFSPRNVDSRWSRGKDETRIELIKMLRKHDPARARELVMESWSSDEYTTRTQFLLAFHHGLSMDDEPFLESCLDDSRKEVREQAQILLMALPGSRLVQRMIDRATSQLTLAKSGLWQQPAITLTYPSAELIAGLKRDEVARWKKGDQFEEGAYYLCCILRAIQPTYWCVRWEITPDELYTAMMNSDESNLLFHAWTQAVIYTHDTDFGVILLREQLEHLTQFDLLSIAHKISDEVREAIVLKWLHQYKDALKNLQVAGSLLMYHRVKWSDPLSQAFLAELARYLNKGKVRPPRELYTILQTAAAQMSPALHPEIMRVLQTDTSAEKMWTDLIDEIRLLLDFRQEMLTAIHSGGINHD